MIGCMASSEDSARTARFSTSAEWLAYGSALPLLLCLAGVGLLPSISAQELAQRIAIAWGAVLLAAGGALHLGLALAGRQVPERAPLAIALLPLLLAALAIVLGGQRALALLVVGYGGLWLYEHRALGSHLPPAYLALRRQLTLASCMLLTLTMFVSDTAGLT
jgi:Protein of unknown function (DUF3429)